MQHLTPSIASDLQLKAENLTFAYGKRSIFRDLSFAVESGDVLHIVGGNGTGKSTLLTMLAGLKQPTIGKVSIATLSSSSQDLPSRRDLCEYLPAEGNALYQTLDSRENLRFWFGLRRPIQKSTDQEITALLQNWGLDWQLPHLRLPVSKFSTGMRRRLALARLMLSPASIWLLDEPLYGLDRKGCQIFFDLIAAHRARGGITLLVTHETTLLESLFTKTLQL